MVTHKVVLLEKPGEYGGYFGGFLIQDDGLVFLDSRPIFKRFLSASIKTDLSVKNSAILDILEIQCEPVPHEELPVAFQKFVLIAKSAENRGPYIFSKTDSSALFSILPPDVFGYHESPLGVIGSAMPTFIGFYSPVEIFPVTEYSIYFSEGERRIKFRYPEPIVEYDLPFVAPEGLNGILSGDGNIAWLVVSLSMDEKKGFRKKFVTGLIYGSARILRQSVDAGEDYILFEPLNAGRLSPQKIFERDNPRMFEIQQWVAEYGSDDKLVKDFHSDSCLFLSNPPDIESEPPRFRSDGLFIDRGDWVFVDDYDSGNSPM